MIRRLPRLILVLTLPLALVQGVEAGVINADVVFANDANQVSTQMTLAFDGTNYWSVSGGGPTGIREAQYDAAGNFVANFSPGIDFRSIFTDAAGNVYARQFNDSTIYEQTAPGVFAAYVTLAANGLDPQSAVVLNGAGTEYIAFSGGTLSRWDLSGNALSSVAFSGFGSMGTENSYPQDRGVAAVGNTYLTYSDGVMSTWDQSGNRIDTNTLVGAGQTFSSYFSFSYTNGRAFVVDDADSDWRGYRYGNVVPEPSSLVLAVIGGLAAVGVAGRRRRAG